MTKQGRLDRGKANYDVGKFLDNSETKEYVATLSSKKPKEEVKKEVKGA